MCVDYRQLNERTTKDSYALPKIDEILESLSGNKYFTVLDMKSGYHPVEIEEHHKERTAFTVGPLGFYEYHRMPFGLANSPATYQRLMEQCLGNLHLSICFIYLDDVIIFSDTFDEHLRRLELVLQRFRETGLKLSAKKCSFFQPKVKYVGHIVSEQGIEPDPDKVQKVVDWPTPTTPEEVRRFLGFVGYYRRFIEGFAKIARPLTDLMPVPTKKKRQKKRKKANHEQKPWKWEAKEEAAFHTLKRCLTSYPILAFPDFDKPFEVHTDASLVGLGAILYQELDGKKRVIAYASRGLSKAEKNYPAHKLEFLALKWSVCEKFYDYLYGHHFTAVTDNNPLTYVMSSAKLDATSQRWVAALASFDFDIKYRPGTANADADSLSRLPGLLNDPTQVKQETISSESIKALCTGVQCDMPFVESLTTSASVLSGLSHRIHADSVDIKSAQSGDPDISQWKQFVSKGSKPVDFQSPTQTSRVLSRDFNRLLVKDDVLYRRSTVDGQERLQMIVPKSHVNLVLKYVHDDMGHQGRDRTISLLRDRFFWNGMTRDAEEYIRNCFRCVCRKTPTTQKASLVNIKSYQPLEIVCMDFLSLETSKGGFDSILVITDHFTKYACAFPTKNQTARTTAEVFIKNFVVHYGLPKRIHSDQGPNFESKLMKEICSITGMLKSHTTPYHPMGNGLCERFNRTLLNMLGTLKPDDKRDWKSHVTAMVHAYNCTRQESTGYSPYFLMFGREPRLPVDLAFGLELQNSNKQSLTQYAEGLKNRLVSAYELAAAHTDKAQGRQKRHYDKKVKHACIHPGDLVLVKVVAHDGKHKLADKWENDPYVVRKQPNPDIPVYVVQKESGEGRVRTLHRNLLLPIQSVTLDHSADDSVTERPRPTPAPRRSKRNVPDSISVDTDSDTESDTEVLLDLYIPEEAVILDTDKQSTVDEPKPVEGRRERLAEAAPVDTQEGREADQQQVEDADRREPPPVPRRSGRERRPPEWFRSGDYVMAIQGQPEWIQRAEYLRSLAQTGALGNCEKQLSDAIFQLVMNP